MEIINEKYNIRSFDTLEEIFYNVSNDYFIITDENVYTYYKDRIDKYNHFIIKHGEDYKTLDTVNAIYQRLLYNGYNRSAKLLGVGGGIVTDITGFVASTYMRGVEFGFIPTTLLAMVDASLGGKNGVNYNDYKNIIGCFKQPSFIYICTKFLDTLPEREYNAGYGEILKYMIGFKSELYNELKHENPDINNIIKMCIDIKMDIVENDEYESGLRKKLNLGHTIAHAIEKYSHQYMHGEAVYIGLIYILKYAKTYGLLCNQDYDKLMFIINKYPICPICDFTIFKEKFTEFINKDKKTGSDNTIDIIVPDNIGHCKIDRIDIKTFIDRL